MQFDQVKWFSRTGRVSRVYTRPEETLVMRSCEKCSGRTVETVGIRSCEKCSGRTVETVGIRSCEKCSGRTVETVGILQQRRLVYCEYLVLLKVYLLVKTKWI